MTGDCKKGIRLKPERLTLTLNFREKARLLQNVAIDLREAGMTKKQLNKGNGWRKSLLPPEALITVFSPFLFVEEGLTLRGYQQYQEDLGSISIVYAMPITAYYPEPTECMVKDSGGIKIPKPTNALDNVMQAIRHLSKNPVGHMIYLFSSILARELKEFGASWHSTDWGNKTILRRPPWKEKKDRITNGTPPQEQEWTFIERPTSWTPHIIEGKNEIAVVFYTFTSHINTSIIMNTDTYQKNGDLVFDISEKVIATAPGGFYY